MFKTNSSDILLELCDYSNKLQRDTLCLLPTRTQYEEINKKILDLLSGEEVIKLIAREWQFKATNIKNKGSKN